MNDTDLSQQINLGGIVSNAFGEHSLFAVNRNLFQSSDASSVFRAHFGESLFAENTFYIVAGTDSGLLYQYVKSQGVPKGSHYLFVELTPILNLLNDMDNPDEGLSVSDENDWQERANDMDMLGYAIQDRLVLLRSMAVVHGHYGDYWPFWQQIEDTYTAFIKKQRSALNSQAFTARQLENLSENQIPAIFLSGIFNGKTAAVLAGGPSLHELLPWVQQHRQNLLVIAVSRISRSLLEADIEPDIIVSVDPYPINLSVSREMLKFQDKALLVNEYHLSSNLLSCWGGRKVFIGKRYPWSSPLEPKNFPRTMGNTVTNTAVTIAMESGVSQIVLGGVDFCFSQEGYTHASGSAEHALGAQPMYGNKQTTTNSGGMADTDNTFAASADALDRQAKHAEEYNCQMINPAPDATRLPHVKYQTVESIKVSPLVRPAHETIACTLPSIDGSARDRLYKQDLSEIDRVLKELRDIKELSLKALKYNRNFFRKEYKGHRFHNNEKLDRIEKQFNKKYADTLSFIKHFGLHRLIPVIRHNEEFKDEQEENNRLYYQAMLDTSSDLIEVLQRSRKRISCRQEEEKPRPNMQCLFDQWRDDQQLGRAMQWTQNHADVVNQLTKTEQKELQAFQGDFDEYLKKLDRLHFLGIERGVDLNGLNTKAREYYQSHDKGGLLRLLGGLDKHRDPIKANPFIPLAKGYLAELRNEPEIAIEAYQGATEEPVYLDALMRLFELHTKANNVKSSLHVLKKLSHISSSYTPMYADLLQATGDTDTAVNIYTDHLLANPDDLNSMMKLGNIFHQHGATDGVEWAMNYILGKDPDNEAAKAMLRSLDQSRTNGE